jgi:hypothetical protein
MLPPGVYADNGAGAGGTTIMSNATAAIGGHQQSFPPHAHLVGAVLACPPSLCCAPGAPPPAAQFVVTCDKGSKKLKIVTSYPSPNLPPPMGLQPIAPTRYYITAATQDPAPMYTYPAQQRWPAKYEDTSQSQDSNSSALTNPSQQDLVSTNDHISAPHANVAISTAATIDEAALDFDVDVAAELPGTTPAHLAAAAVSPESALPRRQTQHNAPAWPSSASFYTTEDENVTSSPSASSSLTTKHHNKNAIAAPSEENDDDNKIRSPSPAGSVLTATLNTSDNLECYQLSDGDLWGDLQFIEAFEKQSNNE